MQILFFGIFFAILTAINFYIYIRGLQALPAHSGLRHGYSIVFWVVALSFMGGRILENILPPIPANLLTWIGSFWIGAMLYFLIAVMALDLLRLIHHFLPFFPSAVTADYGRAKQIAFAAVTGAVALLLLAGYINAVTPRIRTIDLSIAKRAGNIQNLDIVAVSDIHLGTIVSRSRIGQIVDKINGLHPDLVLLAGDVVDADIAPVIKRNLGESIRSIRSRLGVYAVTGNHEYIGGVREACAYLTEHNVTMLRDESVKIGGALYLVGREDRMSARFSESRRKTLRELMAAVDRSYPVILMDHQPFELEEAVAEGVDLQISGHTHAGQLWPLNYIVNSIYELPQGYRNIGDTHFYVSTGAGTWGPPVRLGNRPEIVRFRLHFE